MNMRSLLWAQFTVAALCWYWRPVLEQDGAFLRARIAPRWGLVSRTGASLNTYNYRTYAAIDGPRLFDNGEPYVLIEQGAVTWWMPARNKKHWYPPKQITW